MNEVSLIATLCAGCGMPLDSELPSWSETVNLTPDLLMLHDVAFHWDEAVVEMDVSFDWCSLPCFARWMYRAVIYTNSVPR